MTKNATKAKSAIKEERQINGFTIKVVKKSSTRRQLIDEGIISVNDDEMDRLANAAVSIAKQSARKRKKPIAVYDSNKKEAYLVDSSGKRVNLG